MSDTTPAPSGSCPTCRRRDPEYGVVCEPCRRWLPVAVRSIADLYVRLQTELAAEVGPVDDRIALVYRWQPVVGPDGKPVSVGGRRQWEHVPVLDDDGQQVSGWQDPAAAALPAGPAPGLALDDLVSSSPEPSTPLHLDVADLLAPVVRDGGRPIDAAGDSWAVTYDVQRREVWHTNPDGRREKVTVQHRRRVGVPTGDQVGHQSVATDIDREVRAFAAAGAPGSRWRPQPTVPEMTVWLTKRLDWACDHYPDIDEFAATLRTLRGRMMAALGDFDAPPVHCDGVQCKRCDRKELFRVADGSGDVECKNPSCMKIYRADEYEDWAKHLAGYERSSRSEQEVRDLLHHREPHNAR